MGIQAGLGHRSAAAPAGLRNIFITHFSKKCAAALEGVQPRTVCNTHPMWPVATFGSARVDSEPVRVGNMRVLGSCGTAPAPVHYTFTVLQAVVNTYCSFFAERNVCGSFL